MFLLFIYLVSAIAWGLVLYEMVRATVSSIKTKTDTPRLLFPLAIASLALFIESSYLLTATFYQVVINKDASVFFTQDHLFIAKLFIAISGVFMLMKLKVEKKN